MKTKLKKRLQALILGLVTWPSVSFIGIPLLEKIARNPVSPLIERVIGGFIAVIFMSLPNIIRAPRAHEELPFRWQMQERITSMLRMTAVYLLLLVVIPAPSLRLQPDPWIPESMPSIECKCDIRVEPLQYFNPKIHRFLELDSAGTTIIIDTHLSPLTPEIRRDLIHNPADTIWPC